MKKFISRSIIILICCFLVIVAFALWSTNTPTLTADQRALNTPDLIQKGSYLATLGDCAACHTKPDAPMYSGGAAIKSPIGIIYPVNITPDKQNGIGEYTLNDFARAVRNGIRKDGVTLYPAMPYPSYSRLSDDDIKALFAYFQYGVKADASANQPNEIAWPLSIRWPVAIWRKIYAPDAIAFNASHYPDDQIARGAYIVEGLGHCGTCHTPRAITLQEKGLDKRVPTYLAGGQIIDGWFTPSLHNDTSGLENWTAKDIAATLQFGRNDKSVVIGKPMNDVVEYSSSQWTERDRQAVAAYLKSLPITNPEISSSGVTATNKESISQKTDVAFLYQTSCASCHGVQGEGKSQIFPALAGNNTVLSPNPQTFIRLVLEGYDVPVFDTNLLPMRMPHFHDRLTDQQIADIITYTRNSWGNQASAVSAEQVKLGRDQLNDK
ncbi:MAG: cytochrome c [Enterobacteriaceae bacterium]|jgi:mono/diheme cytochrome c family protein|nr:cytochrome c [Enterobacteriaceae bacterium]